MLAIDRAVGNNRSIEIDMTCLWTVGCLRTHQDPPSFIRSTLDKCVLNFSWRQSILDSRFIMRTLTLPLPLWGTYGIAAQS